MVDDKKLRTYELLGAKVFKKVVLKVEKIKYTIIDKFMPNSKETYEKYCDKRCKKDCKKVTTENEKQLIINNYKFQKLMYRKELVTKKNRNYHLNLDNPDETLAYLNLNKKIHKTGIIRDSIFILLSLLALLITNPIVTTISIILLILNSIYLLIDFQCINLQNYNIRRLELNKQKLDKLSKKRQARNLKKYGDAINVIGTELTKSESIPTPSEIVSKANNLEELRQMKEMLLTYAKTDSNEKGGQKIK